MFPLTYSTDPAKLSSSIVPRLIEDVVPMSSNTLAPEQGREPQPLWHLFLRDNIIGTLRLSHDEFANLESNQQVLSDKFKRSTPHTWISVSVIVLLDTRAYAALLKPL